MSPESDAGSDDLSTLIAALTRQADTMEVLIDRLDKILKMFCLEEDVRRKGVADLYKERKY